MEKRKIYLVILSLITISLILPAFSIQTKAAKGDVAPVNNDINVIIEEELEWAEKEFEITMYTLDECGKAPNHPWYGITSSGKRVTEGKTVAASSEIPFGTKIKIAGLDNTFVVEDRGGAIKTYRGRWVGIPKIDIYTTDKALALEWGRRKVKGEILMP